MANPGLARQTSCRLLYAKSVSEPQNAVSLSKSRLAHVTLGRHSHAFGADTQDMVRSKPRPQAWLACVTVQTHDDRQDGSQSFLARPLPLIKVASTQGGCMFAGCMHVCKCASCIASPSSCTSAGHATAAWAGHVRRAGDIHAAVRARGAARAVRIPARAAWRVAAAERAREGRRRRRRHERAAHQGMPAGEILVLVSWGGGGWGTGERQPLRTSSRCVAMGGRRWP